MNKGDIIEAVASYGDIPKDRAEKAIDGVLQAIRSGLTQGDRVVLSGFGSFSVSHRKARTGRNPRLESPSRSQPETSRNSRPRASSKRPWPKSGRLVLETKAFKV